MVASLVQNEQTKLAAQAIDRLSTACVAIGVIAPVSAAFYQNDGGSIGVSVAGLTAGVILWFLTAIVLHYAARRVLKGLGHDGYRALRLRHPTDLARRWDLGRDPDRRADRGAQASLTG